MSKCKGCGAGIRFARTAKGKMMPLDVKPRTFFKIETDWEGKDHLRVEQGFVSHFETCPKSKQFKKGPKKNGN